MQLAASNIAWVKEQDAEVYALMQSCGYSGLEIAPTRWFPEAPYEHIREAVTVSASVREQYGLSVCSMQSIWYGQTARIAESAEARAHLLSYTEKSLAFADAIGCGNLVFGCPKNRRVESEAEKRIVIDFLADLAHLAERYSAVISLEANPAIYNTNFANTTREALQIVSEIGSPSLRVNLDFGTVIANGESVESLREAVPWINHVHISEPLLKPIGEREEHLRLFQILSDEGYRGFVSIEMGRADDLAEITKALKYVKGDFKAWKH